MNEHVVLLGACGWQFPQWDDSYYPEGLPEEWRLAYYGNEYPVVLIPAAYWSQGRTAIESWLEETDNRPNFICEWSFEQMQPAQAEIEGLIAALGTRVEGILIALNTMPDNARLETIETLANTYPVCLDWPNANQEQIHAILSRLPNTQRVSICWHGDVERTSDLAQGPLVLARVPSAGQTPRSLRQLLEALLTNAGERQAVLLFDGEPPDLDVVDQAEVILNLL